MNLKIQEWTMKQVNMRRSTDCGNVPPRRSALERVRRALGLVPVTESLRSLSYWRRLKAGGQQDGAES
jgi:hypothetical protein